MLREKTNAGFRYRGRIMLCAAAAWLLVCAPVSPARAAFGIGEVDVNFANAEDQVTLFAGSHLSSWTTRIAMNLDGSGAPDGTLRSLRVQLPPGFVGVLDALPTCSHTEFDGHTCDPGAAVGTLAADVVGLGHLEAKVYALPPSPGAAGELGVSAAGQAVLMRLTIATAPPHNVVATLTGLSASFRTATLTIDGAVPGGSFLTLPPSCAAPLTVRYEAASAEQPDVWVAKTAIAHDEAVPPDPLGLIGCDLLSYAPDFSAVPTSDRRSSPSGLRVALDAPDPSLLSLAGVVHADTERAVLTLPEGMTLNPPVASGLAACTPAELAAETPRSVPGEGCPAASKLGSAVVRTPLLSNPIAGTVYAAEPDDPATVRPGAENPFDSLLALYLVLKDSERGILVTLPIEVRADPATGRLTATVDQIPQLPISSLDLELREGQRAPLTTPGSCGLQQLGYQLTPSSGAAPVVGASRFSPASCSPAGFAPTLSTGVTSLRAADASSFLFELTQGSGESNLSGLDVTLPAGLSADLAAVQPCPDSQLPSGACPPGSRLGHARIAVGTGPEPLWVPSGEASDSPVFLAGPYQGAPYSLLIVVPAQAGPFDLGTVTVRAALQIDPRTAQARVSLGRLPQILDGVPLAYRALRIALDRPGFIRNPTSCEPMAIEARAVSSLGEVAPLANEFQVGDCGALGFKPRLGLRFAGAVGRNGHPRVSAVVRPRPGNANLRRAAVLLPRGVYLDQSHIGGVCTRAEFAAGRCPTDSVYGHVKAWTPLLGRPLQGHLYLREGPHRLPDLAADLDGQVRIVLGGRLTTPHARVRASFVGLPDVPFSRLALALRGGRRGLLVDSENVCTRRLRAAAAFDGQNGRTFGSRPLVGATCGGKGKPGDA